VSSLRDDRNRVKSDVEAKLHDVALGHNVFLAFNSNFPGRISRSHGASYNQIDELDNLSPCERCRPEPIPAPSPGKAASQEC
jgi:hypothetical protein